MYKQTLNLFSDITVLQEYIYSYQNHLYWDISEPIKGYE